MKSRMFASFAGVAFMGLVITQPLSAAIEFETEGQDTASATGVQVTQTAGGGAPLMLLDTQNPNVGGANTSPAGPGGVGGKHNRGQIALRTASGGMGGFGGGATNFNGSVVNPNKDPLPGANTPAVSSGGTSVTGPSLTGPLTTNVSLVTDDSNQGSSDIVEECLDVPGDDSSTDSGSDNSGSDNSGSDNSGTGDSGTGDSSSDDSGSESESGTGSVDGPDAQAVPEPASMLAWVVLAGMGVAMSFLRR